MARNLLVPGIEERLSGFMEVRRRNLREHGLAGDVRLMPTVTVTREFGCEGYPVAERLQTLLEKRSGQPWVVMDRALLARGAADHTLSQQMLQGIGDRNTFLDEILSTFSSRWKSDKDYYRLLCRQIVALAQGGNVILVGRGAALLTQRTPNCFHIRIVAPMGFKVESIRSRMGLESEEARELILERQRQRDDFLKEFLGRDIADPTLYHLLFNNARCDANQIATLTAELVAPSKAAG